MDSEAKQVETTTEPEKQDAAPDIKGCEYHIGSLFQCPHCQHQQAIVDPKLVMIGLQGTSVRLACVKCHAEVLAQSARRIVQPGQPVQMPRAQRRHLERQKQKSGLVGANGKPVG